MSLFKPIGNDKEK